MALKPILFSIPSPLTQTSPALLSLPHLCKVLPLLPASWPAQLQTNLILKKNLQSYAIAHLFIPL